MSFIAPKLDRQKYLDLNGDVMGDADFYSMLRRVYDTIISDGDFDYDTSSVAGIAARQASRANRGDNHRALFFKDADSFFAYQEAFGKDSVLDTAMGSLQRTAKDIALLETFGPNPNNMVRGLIRVGEAELNQGRLVMGKFQNRLSMDYVGASWNVLNGDAGRVAPNRELFADIMQGARNLEVVGKLQSTTISSLSDTATYCISSGLYKIPVLRSVSNFFTSLGRNNKELMIRAGVLADTLSQGLTRWGVGHVGKNWTGMLANATMKVSLLDAWTQAVRRAAMKNMMGTLAGMVRTDWDHLDGYAKGALERVGVNERIWRIWGAAKPYELHGAKFLTTQDIRAIDWEGIKDGKLRKLVADNDITQRDIDAAATRLVSFLTDESGIASLNPDLFTRAAANMGLPKGTFYGEMWRCFMLFKSFPLGFMRRHLERMADLAKYRGKPSAVGYTAAIVTTTTLAGALTVQLKELLAGRDPQDMSLDNKDFWLQAFSTGGGAGFLTDVIVSGLDGQNAYGSPNAVRFLGPVFGTVLDTFDVGKSYYNKWTNQGEGGLYTKDTTKADAKALRLIRGHTPFVNLWYAKGIFDRAIYNDLMEMASPGYLARVEKYSLKNKGSGYWWNMDKMVPQRAPNWDVVNPKK